MKNQRPSFPSHTPVLPSLFSSFSRAVSVRFFSHSPGFCRRGQKESMKRKKAHEKLREKTGKKVGL